MGRAFVRKLTFFTHTIDGRLYGGWYRLESTTDVEVQAMGFLQRTSWEGSTPEAAARRCLEEFVRQRTDASKPTPVLGEMQADLHAPSNPATGSDGSSRPTKQ